MTFKLVFHKIKNFMDSLSNYLYYFNKKEFNLEKSKYTNVWFNYQSFYDFISQKTKYKRFVEVGVWKGHSVSYLANKLKSRKYVEIYAVDLFNKVKKYKDTRYEQDAQNMYAIYNEVLKDSNARHLIKDIIDYSDKAADKFMDKYFDFVFIDADHGHDSVRRDINAWLPKIKKGGIISGHDYDNPYAGVKKAVNEIFNSKRIKTYKNGVWYVDL